VNLTPALDDTDSLADRARTSGLVEEAVARASSEFSSFLALALEVGNFSAEGVGFTLVTARITNSGCAAPTTRTALKVRGYESRLDVTEP
jgi:hypothetical protein